MANSKFDIEKFRLELDRIRKKRDMTWKEVAKESGVSAPMLSRMKHGRRPDINGLAALIDWSGLHIGAFYQK